MDVPGKSNLIDRISGLDFHLECLATIGCDKIQYYFENNHIKHKLIFLDSGGAERFKSIALNYSKDANIAIYLFDLSNIYNDISLSFIYDIRELKILKFIL